MSNGYTRTGVVIVVIIVVIVVIIAAAAVTPINNMQTALGQQTPPFDAISMRVHLTPAEFGASKYGWYRIFTWGMRVSQGSILCPSGGCLYNMENAMFMPSAGGYAFTGTLRVGVVINGLITSKFYTMNAQLNKLVSQEGIGQTTELLQGTIGFGRTSIPDFEYKVVNGTLSFDPYASAPVLTLQGIRG